MTSARSLLDLLVGQTIYTITQRRPNRILRVDGNDVWVATERSPGGEPVPLSMVQAGIDMLERHGEVRVDVPSLGHRSAFVGAVLSQVPGAVVSARPQRVSLATTGPERPGYFGTRQS